MEKTKILYFSEFYAPQNTVQTFRNLKISKYLSKYGFKQYIFTADSPNDVVPELNNDIPTDAVIFRKKLYFNKKIKNFGSLNLKNNIFTNVLRLFKDIVFPIDKNIWWMLSYLHKMIRTIKKENIEYVMIGGYPYCAFVGGYILKKICKVKLILDFHDPWKNLPSSKQQSIIRKISHSFWERICVINANLVTVCTDELKTEFYREYQPQNICVIPNGFDIDDYKNIICNSKENSSKLTFLYTGTYSLNTNAYNPESLIKSFYKFIKRYNLVDCELILVGITDEITKQLIDSFKCNQIICKDLTPKHEVFEMLNQADFLIHFYYPYNHKDTISLKVCEYAIFNKPIICFNTHEGSLYNLLTKYKLGEVANSHDVEDMVNLFNKAYNKQITICKNPVEVLKDYNWDNVVKVLAEQIIS